MGIRTKDSIFDREKCIRKSYTGIDPMNEEDSVKHKCFIV